MKKVFPVILLFFVIGCEIKSNVKPVSYSRPPEPVITKKFVFVEIQTEEPFLDYTEPDYRNYISERAYVIWKTVTYCSEISEFSNFTEDDGYMFMDKIKKETLSQYSKFSADVVTKVNSSSTRELLLLNKRRIKNSKYHAYNSYKEASIERDSILGYE